MDSDHDGRQRSPSRGGCLSESLLHPRLTEARELLAEVGVLDVVPAKVRDEDQVLSEAKMRRRSLCRRFSGYGSDGAGPRVEPNLTCGLWQHERDARWRAARWAPRLVDWSEEQCLEVAGRGDLGILEVDFPPLGRNTEEGITAKWGKVLVGAIPVTVATPATLKRQLNERAKTTGVSERIVIETPTATYLVLARQLLPGRGGRPARVDLSGLVEVEAPLASWWLFLVLTSGTVTKARGEGSWSEPRREGTPRQGTRANRTVEEAYGDLTKPPETLADYLWDPHSGWDEPISRVEVEVLMRARELVEASIKKASPSDADLLNLVEGELDQYLDGELTAEVVVAAALQSLGVEQRCRRCAGFVYVDLPHVCVPAGCS